MSGRLLLLQRHVRSGESAIPLTVGPSWRLWSVNLEVESSSILREYYDLYFHTFDVLRLSIVNIIRVSF